MSEIKILNYSAISHIYSQRQFMAHWNYILPFERRISMERCIHVKYW